MEILIVEDDPLIMDELKEDIHELFKDQFKNVFTSDSVEDAKHIIRERTLDIAILDIQIGKIEDGGILLSQYINANIQDTPQIFITGLSDQKGFDKVKPMLLKGASFRFLKKPFSKEQLRQAIDLSISYLQTKSDRHLNQGAIFLKPLDDSTVWMTTGKGRYEKIQLNSIRYIQSDDHYLKVYLFQQKHPIVFKFNLRDFYWQYLSVFDNFFYLDRSRVINLNFTNLIESNHIYIQNQGFSIPKINKVKLYERLKILGRQ